MDTLRSLVSPAHQRGLAGFRRLLDTPVRDPLFQERMQRIHCQIMMTLVMGDILRKMGLEVQGSGRSYSLDLLGIICLCTSNTSIVKRGELDVVKDINRLTNEAKHKLVFQQMENTSCTNSSDTETLRPLITRVHQRRLP